MDTAIAPPDTLTERVALLNRRRQELAIVASGVKQARQEWERTHTELLALHTSALAAEAEADQALRTAVLAAYAADPTTRKPAPGVEVVLATKCAYPEAEAWARQSGVACKLDVKLFEKVAKDAGLPFVTITQEPAVRVASDLAAALAAPTVES